MKKVKTHFGNVEIKSMAQATAINATGIYKVGNIKDYSKDFKVRCICSIPSRWQFEGKKFFQSIYLNICDAIHIIYGLMILLNFRSMRDVIPVVTYGYVIILHKNINCNDVDRLLP